MESFSVVHLPFVNECAKSIMDAADIAGIQFECTDYTNGEYCYNLRMSTDNKRVFIDGTDVVELDVDLDMSANISFDNSECKNPQQAKLFFKSLSLHFYHDCKEFCKAEWTCADSNMDHPQPHWHFVPVEKQQSHPIKKSFYEYQKECAQQQQVAPRFVPQQAAVQNQNVQPANTAEPFDVSRLHFAISSKWESNYAQVLNKPQKETLIQWIKGCVSSVLYEHAFRYKPSQKKRKT